MTKSFIGLAAVGTLILFTASLGAQEATFKLFHEESSIPAGVTFDETTKSKLNRLPLKSTQRGLDISAELSMMTDAVGATRVVSKDKAVTAIKSMVMKVAMEVDGKNTVEEIKLPLIGKKIVMDRVNRRWECSFLDGEPTAEDKEILKVIEKGVRDEENAWRKIYGRKEYKVGDQVRGSIALFDGLGLADEGNRGSVMLEIDRIEELDGVRCAVLKGKAGENGKMSPDNESVVGIQKGSLAINADVTIWRSIEYAIDLKVEAEGTVELAMLIGGVVMQGKGPFTEVTEVKIRK